MPVLSIEAGAQRLAQGKLVAFATETVYGLGADANNTQAVAAIFAAKGRPKEHPLIVHVADIEQLDFFAASIPAFAQSLCAHFWPGPLTVILPRRKGVADAASGGYASIGLRIPAHPEALALLRAAFALGVQGVAAPSANRFGRISPTTAEHVFSEFGADMSVIDCGACQVGIESTILDCTQSHPVLLRPGVISRTEIEAVCTERVYLPQEVATPAVKAPGTLASHYAPKAQVVLCEPQKWQAQLQSLKPKADVPLGQSLVVSAQRAVSKTEHIPVVFYRLPVQAKEAAHSLFAQMRAIDALGVHEIWVELPPDTPEWEGVRDRLQRAAN